MVGFSAVTLWWLETIGDFMVGSINPFAMCIAAFPLGLMWVCYVCFRVTSVARPWHLANVVALTLMSYFIYRNPVNPRVQFLAQLESLEGKSLPETQRQMAPYLGGEYRKLDDVQWLPGDLQGATHAASYRWNEMDGRYNADVGTLYFRNGVVVATNFSPD